MKKKLKKKRLAEAKPEPTPPKRIFSRGDIVVDQWGSYMPGTKPPRYDHRGFHFRVRYMKRDGWFALKCIEDGPQKGYHFQADLHEQLGEHRRWKRIERGEGPKLLEPNEPKPIEDWRGPARYHLRLRLEAEQASAGLYDKPKFLTWKERTAEKVRMRIVLSDD